MRRFIFFIILFSILSCTGKDDINPGSSSNTPCIDTNCADYTSRAAAQAAFDADPECRGDLDRDNDGIACEESGNSVTICPTTANCGCSGLNKAPCQNSICCKWIVGEGCKCK